jgi:hypothetical protein
MHLHTGCIQLISTVCFFANECARAMLMLTSGRDRRHPHLFTGLGVQYPTHFYCLFVWRDADANIRYGQALWKHSKDDTTYDVMNLTLDLTMPDDNKQTSNKQINSAVGSADSSEGSSSGAPTMAPHTEPLRPAIVMIHGGCFSIGSSEWMGSGRSGHGQAGW